MLCIHIPAGALRYPWLQDPESFLQRSCTAKECHNCEGQLSVLSVNATVTDFNTRKRHRKMHGLVLGKGMD